MMILILKHGTFSFKSPLFRPEKTWNVEPVEHEGFNSDPQAAGGFQ